MNARRLIAGVAAACALALAACGGANRTTITSTLLSWEGEGHSGEYSTTFEGLEAGDPISVSYELTEGTATIELLNADTVVYLWEDRSDSYEEVAFVAAGGDWEARVTLKDATGSVKVTTEGIDVDDDADVDATDAADDDADDEAQVANPFQDAASLDDLRELAGFELDFPEELPGYGAPTLLQAVPDELAQARYGADGEGALVRKGTGSASEVSGDYNSYEHTTAIELGDVEVTLSGEDEDDIALATWEADGFGHSISVDGGIGTDEMRALVELVSQEDAG